MKKSVNRIYKVGLVSTVVMVPLTALGLAFENQNQISNKLSLLRNQSLASANIYGADTNPYIAATSEAFPVTQSTIFADFKNDLNKRQEQLFLHPTIRYSQGLTNNFSSAKGHDSAYKTSKEWKVRELNGDAKLGFLGTPFEKNINVSLRKLGYGEANKLKDATSTDTISLNKFNNSHEPFIQTIKQSILRRGYVNKNYGGAIVSSSFDQKKWFWNAKHPENSKKQNSLKKIMGPRTSQGNIDFVEIHNAFNNETHSLGWTTTITGFSDAKKTNIIRHWKTKEYPFSFSRFGGFAQRDVDHVEAMGNTFSRNTSIQAFSQSSLPYISKMLSHTKYETWMGKVPQNFKTVMWSAKNPVVQKLISAANESTDTTDSLGRVSNPLKSDLADLILTIFARNGTAAMTWISDHNGAFNGTPDSNLDSYYYTPPLIDTKTPHPEIVKKEIEKFINGFNIGEKKPFNATNTAEIIKNVIKYARTPNYIRKIASTDQNYPFKESIERRQQALSDGIPVGITEEVHSITAHDNMTFNRRKVLDEKTKHLKTIANKLTSQTIPVFNNMDPSCLFVFNQKDTSEFADRKYGANQYSQNSEHAPHIKLGLNIPLINAFHALKQLPINIDSFISKYNTIMNNYDKFNSYDFRNYIDSKWVNIQSLRKVLKTYFNSLLSGDLDETDTHKLLTWVNKIITQQSDSPTLSEFKNNVNVPKIASTLEYRPRIRLKRNGFYFPSLPMEHKSSFAKKDIYKSEELTLPKDKDAKKHYLNNAQKFNVYYDYFLKAALSQDIYANVNFNSEPDKSVKLYDSVNQAFQNIQFHQQISNGSAHWDANSKITINKMSIGNLDNVWGYDNPKQFVDLNITSISANSSANSVRTDKNNNIVPSPLGWEHEKHMKTNLFTIVFQALYIDIPKPMNIFNENTAAKGVKTSKDSSISSYIYIPDWVQPVDEQLTMDKFAALVQQHDPDAIQILHDTIVSPFISSKSRTAARYKYNEIVKFQEEDSIYNDRVLGLKDVENAISQTYRDAHKNWRNEVLPLEAATSATGDQRLIKVMHDNNITPDQLSPNKFTGEMYTMVSIGNTVDARPLTKALGFYDMGYTFDYSLKDKKLVKEHKISQEELFQRPRQAVDRLFLVKIQARNILRKTTENLGATIKLIASNAANQNVTQNNLSDAFHRIKKPLSDALKLQPDGLAEVNANIKYVKSVSAFGLYDKYKNDVIKWLNKTEKAEKMNMSDIGDFSNIPAIKYSTEERVQNFIQTMIKNALLGKYTISELYDFKSFLDNVLLNTHMKNDLAPGQEHILIDIFNNLTKDHKIFLKNGTSVFIPHLTRLHEAPIVMARRMHGGYDGFFNLPIDDVISHGGGSLLLKIPLEKVRDDNKITPKAVLKKLGIIENITDPSGFVAITYDDIKKSIGNNFATLASVVQTIPIDGTDEQILANKSYFHIGDTLYIPMEDILKIKHVQFLDFNLDKFKKIITSLKDTNSKKIPNFVEKMNKLSLSDKIKELHKVDINLNLKDIKGINFSQTQKTDIHIDIQGEDNIFFNGPNISQDDANHSIELVAQDLVKLKTASASKTNSTYGNNVGIRNNGYNNHKESKNNVVSKGIDTSIDINKAPAKDMSSSTRTWIIVGCVLAASTIIGIAVLSVLKYRKNNKKVLK